MGRHLYIGSLLLFWLCSSVICQWMVPCSTQDDAQADTSAEPKLPELPDQFQVQIEASIVQKQYTINMMEYYDYPNDRAVVEVSGMRQVINTNTNQVHFLYDNGTCNQMKINSTSSSFAFMIAKDGSHLKTVKDLLYFGPEKGEKYIDGDKQVRGISVNHWSACVSVPRSNSTFNIDYYFSKGTNYTIDGKGVQVPVRAVINGTGHSFQEDGTGMHSFYHIYDFSDFRAGPIKDSSVFEIPVGVYCHTNKSSKPTPELPHQFTVAMESMMPTGTGDLRIVTEQMYYDKAAKVMRVDASTVISSRDLRQFGNRPLRIIQDMENDMLYVIDKWEENCTVLHSQTSDGIVTPEDVIRLIHRADLYQGNKTLGGMDVESWAGFNKTDNSVLEILFKKIPVLASPTFGRPGRPELETLYIPVGIFYNTLPDENQRERKMQVRMYGFSRSLPDPDVFDISPCYELDNHYSFMMVRSEGVYESDVSRHKREYITAFRAAIARGAGVSVMRVTSISVEKRDADTLNIYFRLLDNSLYGATNKKLPSLSDAKQNLLRAVAAGLNFDVQYSTIEKNFELVQNYLWEISSSTDEVQQSTIKRYSSASMAGLGIGMVVIGALLGLGAAYVIYKRISTSVPYQITD